MMKHDRFFSLADLRTTWRQLRKELRQARIRDVIDWLDWAITLDQALSELQKELICGSYHPYAPSRFEAPKSGGSYRVITVPNVRDALVFRHISDAVLKQATPSKVKGAFYSRSHTATPIGNTFGIDEDPSLTAIEIWLRYNEYRSLTLMNKPYRILVVSDISNYFDSIPHDLLLEHISPLGLPRQAIGTLGKLLEGMRTSAGHSSSPRVGLPVDEFDCARQLAHVFLFEHDTRVAKEFGEANYVRWMDDQNIGVDSRALGRTVVNSLTRSLASQRLTLNSGKTKLLAPTDVAVQFQLEANKLLQNWQDRFDKNRRKVTPALTADFRSLWATILARPEVGQGNWDKILKRVYGMAGQLGVPDLETRALDDLIAFPALAERIFHYFARRNNTAGLIDLFDQYLASGENLYELVESQFFESALLLDPNPRLALRLRTLASGFAACKHPQQTTRPLARASAIMCMYWFGASGNEMSKLFTPSVATGLPKEVVRAWLACGVAISPRALNPMLHSIVGNSSDDLARMARFLLLVIQGNLDSVGGYYHQRSRWPARGKFYDARAWLILELCSHSNNTKLQKRTKSDVQRFASLAQTKPERAILARVSRRLK